MQADNDDNAGDKNNYATDANIILKEIQNIRSELREIKNCPLLKTYESVHRVLFLQFLKGIFLGFGSFLGATIVVSMVVYILSNIEFIPIIGELVKNILAEIQK